jgi:hypothetical protein
VIDDFQEIEPRVAEELCRLFPEDQSVELTPILYKSKRSARRLRERALVAGSAPTVGGPPAVSEGASAVEHPPPQPPSSAPHRDVYRRGGGEGGGFGSLRDSGPRYKDVRRRKKPFRASLPKNLRL